MNAGAFAPVGVAVFGVSTPFSYWGFNVVFRVIEAITGATIPLHITSLEQLRDGFARREGGSVVVFSDFPDAELAQFVCGSELPLIVFSDDPADALDWAMKSRHANAMDSARLSSRIFAAVAPVLTAERTILILGGRESSPERIVAEIIERLFPGCEEWLPARTFEFLVELGHISRELIVDRAEYREPEAALSPADAELLPEMKRAVGGYADLMIGKWPTEIDWPLELFTRPDNRPARAPVELTGPARALLYGPYMHLPIGEWTARFEFEIDGALSGVEAMTDVRINEIVNEKTFIMPAKGIYAYDLSFRVADPHLPVEIRLFTKKAAIEGVFLPRSVRVRPGLHAPS